MLEDIIEALPVPALAVSAGERIEAANSAAVTLLGGGILGRNYITILRQPDVLDAIELALQGEEGGTARYLTSGAGRDRTWSVMANPIGETGSALVVFEDKTDMENASVQRRDFVANVSHELKTPLTALLGFIETLGGAAKDDPAAQTRFLAIMQAEAERMNRLVSDLLSLNRVETVARVRPVMRVNVAKQARAVIDALGQVAADSDVKLTTSGLDAPAEVAGDADQLSQVVTNLLENAIKYSGQGSEVDISIENTPMHPMLRGPAVVLSVSDTGEGIDPQHIPRLTERFYRIDTHRSRQQGGTGLGLAIVKHIVNRHRGRVRIESTRGVGSTFEIILPAFSD